MSSRPDLQIQHLSSDQRTQEICRRYWAANGSKYVESVDVIGKAFGLNRKQVLDLVHEKSRAYRYLCPQCDQPKYYSNRDMAHRNQRWDRPEQLCVPCLHRERGVSPRIARVHSVVTPVKTEMLPSQTGKPAQPTASSTSPSQHSPRSEQTPSSAAEMRRAEQTALKAQAEHKRQIVQDAFPPITVPYLDPRTLAFEDAIALLSLLRVGGSEDFYIIEAVSSYAIPFTPSDEMDTEVLGRLIDQALIEVHPDSVLDAFILNEDDDDVHEYYTQDVMYYPLIGPDLAARRQWVAELENIFRSREWPAEWQQAWAPLWKRIALHECLDYLRIVLGEHKLPFHPGEKTRLVLDQALDDFSAAQVFNITWQAAKEAAAFYMRGGVTPQHAANTAVGGIQRRVERARNEKWDVHHFRRRFDRPLSMMARVLFETAMQIGYAGFTERPGAIEPFSVVATTDTTTPAQ